MGNENKLLKKVNKNTILNQTLINHIESKINNINLILGHQKDIVLKYIDQNKIFIIENNNFKSGMLSSILKINENISDNTSGILISLADMPFVTSEDINKLIKIFNENDQKIICIPENKGKLGNPLLLPKKIYKDLIKDISKLSNDRVLKNLILDKKYNYIKVSLSEGVTKDFDTIEDFSL
jgi:molybdenum cofactor cytidylyltransferase